MHNVLAKQEDDNKNCDGKTNQNRKQKEIACMVGGVCDHAGSRHAEARSSGSTRQLLADSSRGTVPDTLPSGQTPSDGLQTRPRALRGKTIRRCTILRGAPPV